MQLIDHSTHSKTYQTKSSTEHITTCIICDYDDYEPHNQFNGVSLNVTSHRAQCMDCGYIGTFEHNWMSYGNIFKCNICQYTSSIIPTPNQSNSTEDSEEIDISLPAKNKDELEN